MKHRMLRHKALIQAARYAFGFSGVMDEDEADRIAAMKDITPARRPQLLDFAEIPSSAPTDAKPTATATPAEPSEPAEPDSEGVTVPDAMALGGQARRDGKRKLVPPDVAQLGDAYADAWRAGWDDADAEMAAAKS